jgi:biotin transport system substrate-specific component
MTAGTGRPETLGTLLTTWTAGSQMSAGVRVGAVLLITVATAAAAQMSVPLGVTIVPLVMQDMVVLLGGAALGSRLGMAAQVLYLAAGMAGLPVFAASAVLPQGPLRLLGPTGGYLISYPFAAFLTGYLAERGFDRRYSTAVLAMAAGLVVIFAFGVSWLALFARPAAVGFSAALSAGFYPFLLGDVFKIFLGAAVLPGVWKIVGPRAGRDQRT